MSTVHLRSHATEEAEMVDQQERPGDKRSRMEDEVLEILNRADGPASFSDHVRRKTARQRHDRLAGYRRAAGGLLAGGPGTMLLGSVAAAILALLVSDVSRLLATLLVVASVALLLLPLVGRWRRPDPTGPKQWRGRDIDLNAPPPPWVASLRERFRHPPRL